MSKDPETAADAERQAIETRTPPVGIAAALEKLRTIDDDAQALWTANGPKRSHITEIGAVLVEVEGVRRIYLVQVFASGKFKLFAECAADWPA